jgi:hypothetical protein
MSISSGGISIALPGILTHALSTLAGDHRATFSLTLVGKSDRRLWAHENCAGGVCGRAQIFRFCVLSLLPAATH